MDNNEKLNNQEKNYTSTAKLTIANTIHDHINFLRKLVLLTDNQIAQEYHVSVEDIVSFENGEKTLNDIELVKWLAMSFGTPTKYLMQSRMDDVLYSKLITIFRNYPHINKVALVEYGKYIAVFGTLSFNDREGLSSCCNELSVKYDFKLVFITKSDFDITKNHEHIVFYEK